MEWLAKGEIEDTMDPNLGVLSVKDNIVLVVLVFTSLPQAFPEAPAGM
jgi:hypothetical protein